ncbi:WbqC family protein [Flavobacteriaceae bacterium XHP0103]|uniref:WbqC family protein n=1 Tax=Marixanthotalea marina TaxID=2844359 RepID=UPI002989B0E2|nr:WbqC family protein [Marixanthotalea marina]MBU3822752.1 WbqC family protein [Marixanthotalea marina]
MTLGIMQPYFMPYLGYLALINHVDQFILFDTPQYIRHGWIERNRVLKLSGAPMYIKVPLLKHHQDTPICSISINNSIDWKSKIFAQLAHYKKKAPYYNNVIELLETVFENEYTSIVDLNYKSLLIICNYLDIKTPISIWSEMNLAIEPVNAPDEWALHISKALKAKSYFNPPGGRSFFDNEKYRMAGIDLRFLEISAEPYKQFGQDFIGYLSILDVMMFCDKEEIKLMINNVTISNL